METVLFAVSRFVLKKGLWILNHLLIISSPRLVNVAVCRTLF